MQEYKLSSIYRDFLLLSSNCVPKAIIRPRLMTSMTHIEHNLMLFDHGILHSPDVIALE